MATLHKICQPFHGLRRALSFDDAEEEVWRTTATEKLAQTKCAIHSLDELNDSRGDLPSWPSGIEIMTSSKYKVSLSTYTNITP